MAEKYPGINPYTYVANNPIGNIDPDGREIVIISGKESHVYSPNSAYEGNNSFIRKNVDALNLANTVDIGKAVIDATVSTNKIMNIVEGITKNENTHEFNIDTMTMTARESNYFGGSVDAEGVMHEVFHFYQSIFGEADRSISTELEAYTYQYSLGLKLGGTSTNTKANENGSKLNSIFNKLIFDESNNSDFNKSFKEGIRLFKDGHSGGGVYDKFQLNEEKAPKRLNELNDKGVLRF